MTNLPTTTFPVLVLALIVSVSAQDRPNAEQRALVEAQALKAADIDLPSGDSAWAVRIIRTGGIAGVTLDITVTSQGNIQCLVTAGSCVRGLTGDPLQSMNLLVVPAAIPETPSSISAWCSDCFITRITVRRREAEGNVRTYFAYWDDVTAAKAPPELVRIAQTALALHR